MTAIVPATAPRPGRRLVVLAVVLVVLAGLLVGGDSLARTLGGRLVAERAQERLQTADQPGVRIDGFPFLSQFAAGRFDAVHLDATGGTLAVGETEVALRSLQATAYDVVATQRFQRIVAGRADVTAVLSYETVAALTGLQLSGAGDGLVRARFDGTFGGTALTGEATGRPVLDVDRQQFTFTDVSVSVDSSPDVSVADAVGQVVFAPIPLERVPYGLRLPALEVRDDGIAVSATAVDLPLQSL